MRGARRARGVFVDPPTASALAQVLEEHCRRIDTPLVAGSRLGDAYEAFVELSRTGLSAGRTSARSAEDELAGILALSRALREGQVLLENLMPPGDLARAHIADAVASGRDEPPGTAVTAPAEAGLAVLELTIRAACSLLDESVDARERARLAVALLSVSSGAVAEVSWESS